ncbi:MAG: YggS family pyridoxal phosphate-dependent enzyme [Bacteroidales bacterium]|nr:YggS family pyridoxal phosphate-dependent enzyme [Bacteroidales bacterium]
MDIIQNLKNVRSSIPSNVTIVAVSKTKPVQMVKDLYTYGHRDFGENKVQELLEKSEELPEDIRWHMIGHLQSNKVKYIAGFVTLIHGVDSLKLLNVINKEGRKSNRVIDCLLQVHIARESTKFGFDEHELNGLFEENNLNELDFVGIRGLMGMATFTEDFELVRKEFQNLKRIFDQLKENRFREQQGFSILSMGMSADYHTAVEEGSNMIRVGSTIFGERNYT